MNKRLGFAGLSKQTAKGSAAASATYGYGLLGGRSAPDPGIDQELDAITLNERIAAQANRNELKPLASNQTRAFDQLVGLLLLGALGGIATVGASAPYTHTITPADEPPWLTYFGRLDTLYVKMADSKLNRLRLEWTRAGFLVVSADFLGAGYEILASAFTTTNDQKNRARFRASGGTFKLDTGSATAVDAPIQSGFIEISNNFEQIILSKAATPDDIFPGRQSVEFGFTLIPTTNLNEWRKIATGSASGTALEDDPVYGSAEVKYVIDANTDLTIAATEIAYLAEIPEVDPEGGPVELEVSGMISQPAAGNAVTATLRNAVASY